MSTDINNTAKLPVQADALTPRTEEVAPTIVPTGLQQPTMRQLDAAQAAEPQTAIGSIASGKTDRLAASNIASNFLATDNIGNTKPELPTHANVASNDTAGRVISNVNGFSEMEAYRILQSAAAKSYTIDTQLNQLANKNVMGMQAANAKELVAQIDGEKHAAISKFIGSVSGAALGAGMGVAGARFRIGAGDRPDSQAKDKRLAAEQSATKPIDTSSLAVTKTNRRRSLVADDGKPAGQQTPEKSATDSLRSDPTAGATASSGANPAKVADKKEVVERQKLSREEKASMLDGSAQAAANIPSQLADMIDKFAGGAHDADVAKIQQKMNEVLLSGYKMTQETSKAAKDKAAKDMESAIEDLKSKFTRMSQESDNIANH